MQVVMSIVLYPLLFLRLCVEPAFLAAAAAAAVVVFATAAAPITLSAIDIVPTAPTIPPTQKATSRRRRRNPTLKFIQRNLDLTQHTRHLIHASRHPPPSVIEPSDPPRLLHLDEPPTDSPLQHLRHRYGPWPVPLEHGRDEPSAAAAEVGGCVGVAVVDLARVVGEDDVQSVAGGG